MTTSVLNATDGPDIRPALEPRLSGASCRPIISRTGELEHLAQADWHIGEVKRHITRQRLRVEHALETGQRCELADSMLHAFEANLRAFENHRELVLNSATPSCCRLLAEVRNAPTPPSTARRRILSEP
jgi:hypothetical protein